MSPERAEVAPLWAGADPVLGNGQPVQKGDRLTTGAGRAQWTLLPDACQFVPGGTTGNAGELGHLPRADAALVQVRAAVTPRTPQLLKLRA